MTRKPNMKQGRDAIMAQIAQATGKADAGRPQSSYAYAQPRSRQGRAALTTYHDPAILHQLKLLSAKERIPQQKLVARALNHLFKEYGLPEIADA